MLGSGIAGGFLIAASAMAAGILVDSLTETILAEIADEALSLV